MKIESLPVSILFTVLALCFTLAVAWLVIKILSRLYSTRVAGGEIQVLSSYTLGARQQLYIVNVRDKDYVLGVTNEQIQVLDTFPAIEEPTIDSVGK